MTTPNKSETGTFYLCRNRQENSNELVKAVITYREHTYNMQISLASVLWSGRSEIKVILDIAGHERNFFLNFPIQNNDAERLREFHKYPHQGTCPSAALTAWLSLMFEAIQKGSVRNEN